MISSEIDSIIDRLLQVRVSRPGRLVHLTEKEIHFLCSTSKQIFLEQPVFLELEAPFKVAGDIHG